MVLEFISPNKIQWIKQISIARQNFKNGEIVILLFRNILEADIEPMHLVSLACFIEYMSDKTDKILLDRNNKISQYLWDKLRFNEYWAGGKNYVEISQKNILNLWRVVDKEKESYAQMVHDYLRQKFFKRKDLSAVKNSLDEVFYNIFDHAEARNNAFSFISFDEDRKKLSIAVCDFGIGIARSVQRVLPNMSDTDAIDKAMEYQFTTKTKGHNKGMGLCNIKDTCTEDDYMIVIANGALMIMNKEEKRNANLDFNFNGTLISYEVTLSHFEDEEIIDSFIL